MVGLRSEWAVKAIVPIRITAILFRCVSAVTKHTVGGASGWDLTSNLQGWTAETTFRVGDFLVFSYTRAHEVLEVYKLDYDFCRTEHPIHTYDDGETVIQLTEPGTRYFISGRQGHCNMGLRLQVQVLLHDQLIDEYHSLSDNGGGGGGDQQQCPTAPPLDNSRPPPTSPASSPPSPASKNAIEGTHALQGNLDSEMLEMPKGLVYTPLCTSGVGAKKVSWLIWLVPMVTTLAITVGYSLWTREKKEHKNIILIGHQDVGKTALRSKLRELSTSRMEGDPMFWCKGQTQGVHVIHFDTSTCRYSVLDTEGPNSDLLSYACPADIGIVLLSAQVNANLYGQVIKHAIRCARLFEVEQSRLVIVLNKMDDVQWSKEWYDEAVNNISEAIEELGITRTKNLTEVVPVSSLFGTNLKSVDKKACRWWKRAALLGFLDSIKHSPYNPKSPFRMPILSFYEKDREEEVGEIYAMGRVLCGTIHNNDELLLMPSERRVTVAALICCNEQVEKAGPGENIEVQLRGVLWDHLHEGFVLCCPENPIQSGSKIQAIVDISGLEEGEDLRAADECMLHCLAIEEWCMITQLSLLGPKNDEMQARDRFFNGDHIICWLVLTNNVAIDKRSKIFLREIDSDKVLADGEAIDIIGDSRTTPVGLSGNWMERKQLLKMDGAIRTVGKEQMRRLRVIRRTKMADHMTTTIKHFFVSVQAYISKAASIFKRTKTKRLVWPSRS